MGWQQLPHHKQGLENNSAEEIINNLLTTLVYTQKMQMQNHRPSVQLTCSNDAVRLQKMTTAEAPQPESETLVAGILMTLLASDPPQCYSA